MSSPVTQKSKSTGKKSSGKVTMKKSKKQNTTPTIKKHIQSFRNNGADILDKLSKKMLQKILETSREAYYNDEPIITDNEYDIFKEYMEKKDSKNVEVTAIGADVKADKVKLPYFMGSMDKIKPDTNAIERWKKQFTGPYVISSKLDGVSGLYSTEGTPALYTRGNGKVGQDISKFIGKLHMPEPQNIPQNIVVRGEFIIRQDIFKVYYGANFSNARNFVSGVINSKSPSIEKLGHVDFVAYELIKPELKPSDQFEFLKKNGFIVSNFDEVLDILHELIDRPDLLKRNSQNVLELADKFDWKIVINDWEKVIDNLI